MEKKQLCCDELYGVLPYQEIKRLIKNGNLIEEYDEKSIKESSYEIRVGSYFDFETNKREPLAKGEVIGVEKNCSVLLGSLEHFKIPKDITALMWLRSTYARDGWTPWFQGLVDPGFVGRLTIVLHNITDYTKIIVGGDRICHIRFNKMMEATEKPYTGKYAGSQGAQPPIEDNKKGIYIKKIIKDQIGKDELGKALKAIELSSKY